MTGPLEVETDISELTPIVESEKAVSIDFKTKTEKPDEHYSASQVAEVTKKPKIKRITLNFSEEKPEPVKSPEVPGSKLTAIEPVKKIALKKNIDLKKRMLAMQAEKNKADSSQSLQLRGLSGKTSEKPEPVPVAPALKGFQGIIRQAAADSEVSSRGRGRGVASRGRGRGIS